MKVVRGRGEARWMPSRFQFALFRLFAYLRLRKASPELMDVAFIVDRHQSAVENFTVGIWTILSLSAYVLWQVLPRWPIAPALLAAPVIAVLLMHISIVVVGLLLNWRENNLRVNSFVMFAWLTAAALYFARVEGWVRYAAWQFLGVMALNAVAALIVMTLREGIAAAEGSLGGFSSEL